MDIGTTISIVALGISGLSLIFGLIAEKSKANQSYADQLKSEINNHATRITNLEFLLGQCEAEREGLRKDQLHNGFLQRDSARVPPNISHYWREETDRKRSFRRSSTNRLGSW